MNKDNIKVVIYKMINTIIKDQDIVVSEFDDDSTIVDDIGFESLDVATLVAMLERELHVNPFIESNMSMADIRTVGDIQKTYYQCLNQHEDK